MDKKVILITGASSGMGHESAKQLLELGHIVYCGARRVHLMKDLEELGGKVFKFDVTKASDRKKFVNAAIKNEGRIDVLYNNAGFGLYGPVEEVSEEDAHYQLEVNLHGLASMTRLVIPQMREQKSGLIINTSSMGGKIYTPLGAWYHATKHAVEGFSDCLRYELRPFGINVVILEPGAINTEFGDAMLKFMKHLPKGGPYKDQKEMFESADEMFDPSTASPASFIAGVIVKIINSKKPKRRYLVGKMAKQFVYLRMLFGDGIYEKTLDMAFGRMIKQAKERRKKKEANK